MLSTVFLVRPEEFESPTSRLRRPVFYPVELETHCVGATSWTRTSHTQIFSLLLYLMSYRGKYISKHTSHRHCVATVSTMPQARP